MKHVLRKIRADRRNQKGQAGLEFIVSMVVIFFFLLFMLSLAIMLVISDYVEYATFMAARTYKAGASGPDKQFEHAQIVFDTYVEKIQGIGRNFRLQEAAVNPADQQTAGLVATYEVDLFYMPPLFIGEGALDSRITLTSEAYLGRDPSFEECQNFFFDLANSLFRIESANLVEQMADNGC